MTRCLCFEVLFQPRKLANACPVCDSTRKDLGRAHHQTGTQGWSSHGGTNPRGWSDHQIIKNKPEGHRKIIVASFRCQGTPECLKSKKMQEVWMYNLLRHSSGQLPVAIFNYKRISSGASVEFKWSTQSKHTLGQEYQSPARSVGWVLRMKRWRDLFLLNMTFLMRYLSN